MYSSDRMKTLIILFKDYDKNIVFMYCQIHFLNIYLRRNQILLIFFRHFVELPAKSQPLLNYFWDISRDWEAARNDNSALEIVAKLENWRQVKYV